MKKTHKTKMSVRWFMVGKMVGMDHCLIFPDRVYVWLGLSAILLCAATVGLSAAHSHREGETGRAGDESTWRVSR